MGSLTLGKGFGTAIEGPRTDNGAIIIGIRTSETGEIRKSNGVGADTSTGTLTSIETGAGINHQRICSHTTENIFANSLRA